MQFRPYVRNFPTTHATVLHWTMKLTNQVRQETEISSHRKAYRASVTVSSVFVGHAQRLVEVEAIASPNLKMLAFQKTFASNLNLTVMKPE